MPSHLHPDDIPATAPPMIISESDTHVVIAVEIAKAVLASRLSPPVRAAHRGRRSEGGAAMTKVTLDLPPDEAMALAQMVKRLGYDDAERLSSRYDGGHERDLMLAGVNKLQRALAEAGFAPR